MAKSDDAAPKETLAVGEINIVEVMLPFFIE
jgi:hypothetical protein